jgi:hypothetical protein
VGGEDHQVGRNASAGGWIEAGDRQNGFHDGFLLLEGVFKAFPRLFEKLAGSGKIVLRHLKIDPKLAF